MRPDQPTCWNCGYTLTGLRVDDRCPECGTAIWSSPPGPTVDKSARDAFTWGIVALVLFFVCLGPLAGLLAIPAIRNANRAMELHRTGRIPESAISGARAGLICGWITAVLSLLTVAFYALALLFAGTF